MWYYARLFSCCDEKRREMQEFSFPPKKWRSKWTLTRLMISELSFPPDSPCLLIPTAAKVPYTVYTAGRDCSNSSSTNSLSIGVVDRLQGYTGQPKAWQRAYRIVSSVEKLPKALTNTDKKSIFYRVSRPFFGRLMAKVVSQIKKKKNHRYFWKSLCSWSTFFIRLEVSRQNRWLAVVVPNSVATCRHKTTNIYVFCTSRPSSISYLGRGKISFFSSGRKKEKKFFLLCFRKLGKRKAKKCN